MNFTHFCWLIHRETTNFYFDAWWNIIYGILYYGDII